MKCKNCPVAEGKTCLGDEAKDRFGYYCEWAKENDEQKRRVIVGRSAIGILPSPGIVQKVANFATAVASHFSAGLPEVSPEVKNERLAICQACEWFDGAGCRKCGCTGLKLTWAEQACPLAKWGPANQRV